MINQLNEEINEKNISLNIQQLKEEELKRANNQLHKLINKYHESKNANKISIGCQTEEVGILYNYTHAHTVCSHVYSYNYYMQCHNYSSGREKFDDFGK